MLRGLYSRKYRPLFFRADRLAMNVFDDKVNPEN